MKDNVAGCQIRTQIWETTTVHVLDFGESNAPNEIQPRLYSCDFSAVWMQMQIGQPGYHMVHLPATFVAEKFVLSIQRFSGAKIFETACDWSILLNIKAQVKKCLVSCRNSFTPQASCLICQNSLIRIIRKGFWDKLQQNTFGKKGWQSWQREK